MKRPQERRRAVIWALSVLVLFRDLLQFRFQVLSYYLDVTSRNSRLIRLLRSAEWFVYLEPCAPDSRVTSSLSDCI